MRQTCGASPLQRAQGKGHHGDQIIQVPLFCTDKGRFTASPDRAATVPVLAAVRQAKRTKERQAAGLQQNRFSVVIEKLLLTLGNVPTIRRYSHLPREDGQRVRRSIAPNLRS